MLSGRRDLSLETLVFPYKINKEKVRMAKPKARKHSADQMMLNVASSLVRDFQNNLDDPSFCCDLHTALQSGDIAEIRRLSPEPSEQMDVATYKATYQMQSVLKRWRFRNDLYSDEELKNASISKFLETQHRIHALDLTNVDEITTRVVNLARIYVSQVLGPYDDEQHRHLCRFGRKASVGIPGRLASEAQRWELPISGSREQISWFDSEMSQVACVQDYWAKQKSSDLNRSTYQETDSLTLTLVPKTFKSLRAIMPNTTIGSYQSFGLGEIMRKRLKRKGYDIRSLQMRHRVLAREASIHGLYTTADLSSASDSISVALVDLLFPPDWLQILHASRIGKVSLPDGTVVQSDTFCTMGIGYTFPLQTLVFLSLLKAIEAILFNRWNRRTISVYGDDMIYVSSMHSTVVHVFSQLGFVLNHDKTFSSGNFRESCGGDYFHGVDVRPFQPRNGSAFLRDKAYEAMLYKFVNSLLTRWSEHEIGRTLRYLSEEIERVTGKCKLVPGDFPDDSGIKCPTLSHWSFLQCVQCARPKAIGHGVYRFSYLRLVPDEREELRHEPYLWARLRASIPDSPPSYVGSFAKAAPFLTASVIDYVTSATEQVPFLIERKKEPIETVRSKLTGCRLPKVTTYSVISNTGRYMRRSGTSCFEDRR